MAVGDILRARLLEAGSVKRLCCARAWAGTDTCKAGQRRESAGAGNNARARVRVEKGKRGGARRHSAAKEAVVQSPSHWRSHSYVPELYEHPWSSGYDVSLTR